ncbi:hypothetical protein J3R30DRAFT_3707966 [Lentinula aciculospora]|uniref:DUF6699 domain-containing protein n=1 Tax=Lentinula aciculospora TaxID=153920 RepID=A0A9W9A3U6_9AGAR|nr:hypothetical protein J3R30DRAFT_3707966 [Lentinula aciculospora]
MPALMKRVRFSSINALYSPVPTTPYVYTTSTSTSSSKSSHSEGSKPSKRRRHVSKLTTHSRSRPLDISVPITRIHYLLAFAPYQLPPLPYDLSTRPSIIKSFIPSDVLSEPATNPPVSSLIITCPHLRWEFPITPIPASSRKSSYVSVLDVLHALYRGLRLAVHPLEYEALPSLEVIANVNEAYYSRCNSTVDTKARQEEQVKGIKRVDFLMGRNRFLGLSKKSSRRDDGLVWELNVS